MPTALDKIMYTAKGRASGGREGTGRSDDGRLDVKLTSPGGPGTGTNPEQLFAIGYAACFIGALKVVGPKMGVTVPSDVSIDSEVDLGPTGSVYSIAVRLTVNLPGVERAQAEKLVEEAHKVCPYSNATRGNINVELKVA